MNTDAEKLYTGTLDYLVSQIPLDKLKLVDSVSEKDSERSIKKPTNDIFIEINEKISACFNTNGFAIHIKLNGIVLVKNYIIKKINCNIIFNEQFNVDDQSMINNQGGNYSIQSFSHGSSNLKKVRVNQVHDSVDYQRLVNSRTLNFQPPLG